MIELTETLLPDLPSSLEWVYGVFYIIEGLVFFLLIIMPFIIILNVIKHRKRRY